MPAGKEQQRKENSKNWRVRKHFKKKENQKENF